MGTEQILYLKCFESFPNAIWGRHLLSSGLCVPSNQLYAHNTFTTIGLDTLQILLVESVILLVFNYILSLVQYVHLYLSKTCTEKQET